MTGPAFYYLYAHTHISVCNRCALRGHHNTGDVQSYLDQSFDYDLDEPVFEIHNKKQMLVDGVNQLHMEQLLCALMDKS
jgi:hypothetical protein